MNKDELLGKYPIVANNEGTRLFVERNFALKAMDEYAKQQAIEFDKWKCIQGYSVAADGMHFRQQGKYIEPNTSENLYNQFIEQQNKEQ